MFPINVYTLYRDVLVMCVFYHSVYFAMNQTTRLHGKKLELCVSFIIQFTLQ